MRPLRLNPDRFFPSDAGERAIARELFAGVRKLPIISPHGHTDPAWFSTNAPFEDAVSLLIWPDHYLLRLLYGQGVSLESWGLGPRTVRRSKPTGARSGACSRRIIMCFAARPRGCGWIMSSARSSDLDRRLELETADYYYDVIAEKLAQPDFRPRTLFERFDIEVIATTETALDPLAHHDAIVQSGWKGRVITTFRPDEVMDPDHEAFTESLPQLADLTGEDVMSWKGYLQGAGKPARLFPRTWRHRHRSRPGHGADRRSFPAGSRGAAWPAS